MSNGKDDISVKPAVRRDGTREGKVVSFEATVRSEANKSMFNTGLFLTPENIENFFLKVDSKKSCGIASGFGLQDPPRDIQRQWGSLQRVMGKHI